MLQEIAMASRTLPTRGLSVRQLKRLRRLLLKFIEGTGWRWDRDLPLFLDSLEARLAQKEQSPNGQPPADSLPSSNLLETQSILEVALPKGTKWEN